MLPLGKLCRSIEFRWATLTRRPTYLTPASTELGASSAVTGSSVARGRFRSSRPGGRIDRGRATGLPVAPIRIRRRERADGSRTPTDFRQDPRTRNDVQDADESLASWTRHRIGVRQRHRRRIAGAPARFACATSPCSKAPETATAPPGSNPKLSATLKALTREQPTRGIPAGAAAPRAPDGCSHRSWPSPGRYGPRPCAPTKSSVRPPHGWTTPPRSTSRFLVRGQ
jgi:hypothetical protein